MGAIFYGRYMKRIPVLLKMNSIQKGTKGLVLRAGPTCTKFCWVPPSPPPQPPNVVGHFVCYNIMCHNSQNRLELV